MLDHLDDIESDMSVFHRIDDAMAMPSTRFFRLAERLFAYEGVLASRVRIQAAREQPPQPQRPHDPEVVEVESTATAIAASPLGQIMSITQV